MHLATRKEQKGNLRQRSVDRWLGYSTICYTGKSPIEDKGFSDPRKDVHLLSAKDQLQLIGNCYWAADVNYYLLGVVTKSCQNSYGAAITAIWVIEPLGVV